MKTRWMRSFTFSLGAILCLVMTTTTASAQQRITEAVKKEFLVEIKEGLLEHRQVNDGRLETTKMKPALMEYMWELHYEDRAATQEEIIEFQREFDKLVARRGMTDDQVEAAIMELLERTIDKINASPLQCIKQGQSCNQWSCCDGLVCADVPGRLLDKPKNNRCVANQKTCENNGDCCSGYCENNLMTQQKTCQPQKRCFKPVALGNSCNESPVCGEGSCEKYNANTLGIGECASVAQSCQADGECCSGSCKSGKCAVNYMCKDCVRQGEIPERGRKCCEGLMQDRKTKRCIIDLPPFVQNKPVESIMKTSVTAMIMSLFIGTAHAEGGGNDQNTFIRQGETETVFSNELNEVQGEGGVQEVRDRLRSGALNEYDATGNMGFKTGSMQEHDMELDDQTKMIMDKLNRAGGKRYSMLEGSNFETCEINFRNDYLINIAEPRKGYGLTLHDLQLSLMGFEYVTLGAGVQDLWKVPGESGTTNLHTAAKNIAKKSREQRRKVFEAVAGRNEQKLTCLCYDKNGYDNLQSEQQQYFQQNCAELYQAYLAEKQMLEELGQEAAQITDASGIKYKNLMVAWYEATAEFEEELFISHTNLSGELRKLKDWAVNNNWNEVEYRRYPLFRFTIKNYKAQVMFGTAIATALVSAGIIAITGGFAAGATLSAWAAAGIITAAAASGSLGVWFVGSLKGAWQAQSPLVSDEYVKGRESYKCGKKDMCSDFSRVLHQPYNKVCGKHISANACIRSFLVTSNKEGETRYLIDPWVPWEVDSNVIIKDKREYASLLEDGFRQARSYLSGNNPAQVAEVREDLHCRIEIINDHGGLEKEVEVCETVTVTNVIHPSGFRPESYLEETFVDEVATSQFLPKLKSSENTYLLTEQVENAVKAGAKKYAVEEGFFLQEETENLEKFASYVWEYHYIFPRLSASDAISYPTPGLTTYLELVAEAMDQTSEQNLAGREKLEDVASLVRQDRDFTASRLNRANQFGVQTGDVRNIQGSDFESSVEGSSVVGQTGDFLTGASQFAGTQLSGAAQAVGGAVDDLTGGDLSAQADRFQAALALRNRIDEEKKADFENWKEQVGDTDRGKRILAAQDDLVGKFMSPSSYGSSGSGLASSGLRGSDLAKADLSNASLGDKGAVGAANRNPVRSGLPSGGENPLLNAGGLGSGSASGTSGYASGDADRMREAIRARDEKGLKAYETQEGDSIWEIVTNTYIRVYDRLLPKRNELRDLEN